VSAAGLAREALAFMPRPLRVRRPVDHLLAQGHDPTNLAASIKLLAIAVDELTEAFERAGARQ
jgi:hypothetical protein